MVNILVTGASGYIGRHLCSSLNQEEFNIFPVVRHLDKKLECIPAERHIVIEDCNEYTDWHPFIKDIDVVVHLMARAHKPSQANAENLFRKENVDVFNNLIDHALSQDIKQIIFLSSIGVNGENTQETAFRAADAPSPVSPYAKSKWQAERLLQGKLVNTNTMFTTIRPPLVYHGGKDGYKGNLRLLEKLIATKLPLPLSNIQNRRSLVSVQNLTSLIQRCIQNPAAYNKMFLVADPKPISTSELLSLMSHGKARLFPLPKWFFSMVFTVLGKQSMQEKLFGNLEVDITDTKQQLDWQPPLTAQESFKVYDT